jgi:aspartyl aminopeptidase
MSSLQRWLDACPTPFHVVEFASSHLTNSGFIEITQLSIELPPRGFIRRDGALIAWNRSTYKGSAFHIVGAHTDSPNIRIQPHPDMRQAGFNQLGVEIYGGVLLNSWLDRDLGIAGRVVANSGEVQLFSSHKPLARIPQLAIHLDREVNDKGLLLNKQIHLTPVWATHDETNFLSWLARETNMEIGTIAAFDAHLFDLTPAMILGADHSMLASARLDNQLSCWAAIHALTQTDGHNHTAVAVLNDHEEVGSVSTTGADGPLLEHVLTSLSITDELNISEHSDRLRASRAFSVDNAHALHPNYMDRHDPKHAPIINKGPAVKVNGNQRYATTATGIAYARSLAASHDIPMQTFVSRNDMPCGSTIGPITAGRLGIETVDIGVPQLSMHSAREMCGVQDAQSLLQFLTAFYAA